MNFKNLLLFIGAVGVSATASAGSVTVTNNQAAFTAGLPGTVTVEDFTDTAHFPISSGVLNSSTTDAGLVAGEIKPGVTYSVQGPVIGNGFNIDAGGGFVGGFLDTVTNIGPVNVAFDHAASGFGFTTNYLEPDVHVVVNFADGSSQTFDTTLDNSNLTFFGFDAVGSSIVSAQIGSLSNPTFSFAIDNFTFNNASVSAVPEPGNLAMLVLGVAGLAVARRRRSNAQR
jgi:hypothetical protein